MPDKSITAPGLALVRTRSPACPSTIAVPVPGPRSGLVPILVECAVGPVQVTTAHEVTPDQARALAAGLLVAADLADPDEEPPTPAELGFDLAPPPAADPEVVS